MFTVVRRLQFWYNAKNRHGIHSPFVFEFVEQILNASPRSEKKEQYHLLPSCTPCQSQLICRILGKYGMVLADPGESIPLPSSSPRLWLRSRERSSWPSYFHPGDIFVYPDIHTDRRMDGLWKADRAHPQVTMSIEIWNMGLLFFRSDFKVRQHFMVKKS